MKKIVLFALLFCGILAAATENPAEKGANNITKAWDPNLCIEPSMNPAEDNDTLPGILPSQLVWLLKRIKLVAHNSVADRLIPDHAPILRFDPAINRYKFETIPWELPLNLSDYDKLDYKEFPIWFCAEGTVENVRLEKDSETRYNCSRKEMTNVSNEGEIMLICAWTCTDGSAASGQISGAEKIEDLQTLQIIASLLIAPALIFACY